MSISNNYPNVRPSLLLDFANTKTLDPRITFTRASTATYYDGKTVAKAEENLLQYSQEFDNAFWNKNNSSITANSTTAPDGTTTADSLIEDSANNIHYLQRGGSFATTSGQVYAFSVYAKANTRTWLYMEIYDGANYQAYFNLSTGVTGTVNGGVTATITDAGNGWYRCSIVRTVSTGAISPNFGLASADNTRSYLGNGTSGIYIWGAQLEQRSSVTAYTVTTSAPITNYIPALQTAASGVARFEHNPTTGESLGLLIEESRTNLLTYSDDFANGSWTKYPSATTSVTSNTIVAPDGTLTGDQVVGTTSNYEVNKALTKAASAITYTLSGYLKAGSTSSVQLTMSDNSTGQAAVTFNLSTGVISVAASNGTWSGASATITSVGNGWYRCTLTATSPANTGLLPVFNGTGGAGNFFIWGAQLEAGSFATSYIPTTSATVTRAADSASMTGTNFSSWYGGYEGTYFFQGLTGASGVYRTLLDGSVAANQMYLSTSANSGVVINGISTSNGVTANASTNVAYGFSVTGQSLCLNGGTVSTNTTRQLEATQLIIGRNRSGGEIWNSTIRKVAFYPKRLTNAELQGLTTI